MPRPNAPEGMKRLFIEEKTFDKIEALFDGLGAALKEEKLAAKEGREATNSTKAVMVNVGTFLKKEWPKIKEASGIKPKPVVVAPVAKPAIKAVAKAPAPAGAKPAVKVVPPLLKKAGIKNPAEV